MKDDGTWDEYNGDEFKENPHFNNKDGLIPNSVGDVSKIKTFCFELHRLIVIL
jgi:hypothetical protein